MRNTDEFLRPVRSTGRRPEELEKLGLELIKAGALNRAGLLEVGM
jgi:hypothetical protein